MQAFIYQAALLCFDCGKTKQVALDQIAAAFGNVSHDYRNDSDKYPQGPYANGGGEADCPQHCDFCGVFLDNPLTPDGVTYVLEAIKAFDMEGRGNPKVISLWRDQYAGVLWSESTGWNASEQNNKA